LEQAGRDPASETMTRLIMLALQGLLRELPEKGYGLEK
jgi:hypothetical protein